jgi:hypothetical protein
MSELRPREFCEKLLLALAATDGRRKQRKRNTTPDAIGLSLKRDLLQGAMAEDPEPADFERWLFEKTLLADGGAQAMAQEIGEEWKLFQRSPALARWLEQGAPSDDAEGG